MNLLRFALAAIVAFGAGWGAHFAVAQPLPAREETHPTPEQKDAARKEDERKAKEPKEDVITALNVRDPASLVMGPSASSPRCLPTKPCDCTAEKLKRARREQPERF